MPVRVRALRHTGTGGGSAVYSWCAHVCELAKRRPSANTTSSVPVVFLGGELAARCAMIVNRVNAEVQFTTRR